MKKEEPLSFHTKKRGSTKDKFEKDEVYERLKNWIIFTQLKPGSPLNERKLAIDFGISRTPLREILQRLSYQHLLVIKPRSGIFVAPIDYFNLKSTFEVRAPVEAKAASLAARRASNNDIVALEKVINLSYKAQKKDDLKRLIQLDQIFHETLGDISKNPILRKIIEDLHNVCLRFWYLSIDSIPEDYQSVNDLERTVAAIRKGDQELAAKEIAQHVMRFSHLFE